MSAPGAAQIDLSVRPGPAKLQLASGTLGALLAVATLCPAVGAASLGALSDGRRYADASAAAPTWRFAFGAVSVLALGSVIYPFLVDHTVLAWPMFAFAFLGVAANAASVLAALPARLSALHASRLRASSMGYAVLAGAGLLALVRPAGWVCVAAVVATTVALAAERLLGARRAG